MSVVVGLGFGGWPSAEAVHEPAGVVPVDPGGGDVLVPGLDRSAAAGSEYQAGVLPRSPERQPVGGLLLLANQQRGAGQARDGQIAIACPGLDRA